MSEKIDYGHWVGPEFDPEDYFGFVYVITNTLTGRKYIGQKQLHSTLKRPPLKGRKNKRHSKRESKWREYTGSSRQLNEDMEELGKDKFTFEIIELHESRWELSYGEYCKIINEQAIPSRKYYNEFLGKIGKCPEKAKLH
jgi:hypothetical protein